MLEEYVDGVELNGMIVVRDGEPTLLTLSERLRPPGPGFGVGWIHSFPPFVSPRELEHACELAFDAVRALGLQDGIAFPQLIVRGDDAWLIEIAARIAAGQMADLVRFATGIELFDVAILQALGRPVPDALVTPTSLRPIAIRFLTASPGVLPVGTVTAIDGLDEVRSSDGVLAADLYFGIGATIGPVQVDADRRGYVIATAETAEHALTLAEQAAEKLSVRVAEPARHRAAL
jgi:biotin carboxylase